MSALSDVDLGKAIGEINKKIAGTLKSQLTAMQGQAIANQVGGFGGALLSAIFGKPEDYDAAIKHRQNHLLD